MKTQKNRWILSLLTLMTVLLISMAVMTVSAEGEETAGEQPEVTAEQSQEDTFTGLRSGKLYKDGKLANGWMKVGSRKYYAKKGVPVKGRKKISRKWYFFKSNGVMATDDVKEKKVSYFINKNKNLEAYKKGKVYYKPSGKKMKKAAREDYITLRRARKIARKITKPGMTKKQKLEKCFKYIMNFNYKRWRTPFPAKDKTWVSLYANDHFVRGSGDCHADAAAFAYLARALGYKNVWVCLDAKLSNPSHHAWTYVDGRYYDPLFAQSKSYSKYWNAKTYPLHAIVTKKVGVGYVGDK